MTFHLPEFLEGNYINSYATFKVEADPPTIPATYVLANPDTVTFAIVSETGARTEYHYGTDANVTLLADGKTYKCRWKPPSDGKFESGFIGTGDAAGNGEQRIQVTRRTV